MTIPKAFSHQVKSVAFKRDHPRSLDWSDCGTGKTRTELDIFDKYGAKCALVLAPKSILGPAWAEDIETFTPHLKYSVAYAENRTEAFKRDADIYITNHDAVKWLAQQSPKFFERFTELKVDESTAFKHYTSKRSRALAKIKKYFPVRREMTATPNPNTITDIWHQAYIVDDGERLGHSFFAFRSATCIPMQVGPEANMLRWVDRDGSEVAVMGLLAPITIRHRLEDCTDIPPNHLYVRKYNLKATNRKVYMDLERVSIAQVKESTITAVNGAVLCQKLLQVASGAVYDDSGSYTLIDTGRYELVLDLVEEQRQSIVFFNWAHQRHLLVEESIRRDLKFAVLDGSVTNIHTRNDIIKNFQKGFYRTLFIHPQTGSHGLTLTAATRTIWASPTYNFEHFHQGIKRIHRAGQREVTETIVVVAPDTYDEVAFTSAQNKGVRMGGLLEFAALRT